MEVVCKDEILKEIENISSKGIWLYHKVAKKILNSKEKCSKISLDLNKNFKEENLYLLRKKIGTKNLEKVCRDEKCCYYFNLEENKLIKIYLFDEKTNKIYKLYPTDEAPTLDICGTKMHRVKSLKPWQCAMDKVSCMKISKENSLCLDTCMGLGYTAINLSKFCEKVITFEKDENVIEITKWNPWSYDLYLSKNIEICWGDIYEEIKNFDSDMFDYILHDPPAIYMAGELYSSDFYEELYRVLKKGGILYHYVGYRGEGRGIDIIGKVMQRLSRVGFKVYRKRDSLGVIAIK